MARITYLMDLFVRYEEPILFVGPTGTGKSAYVQQKLMHGLSKDKYLPTFVNFSAQTSANQTQVQGHCTTSTCTVHHEYMCAATRALSGLVYGLVLEVFATYDL